MVLQARQASPALGRRGRLIDRDCDCECRLYFPEPAREEARDMHLHHLVAIALLATFEAPPVLANSNCPESCFIGHHDAPNCTTDSIAAHQYFLFNFYHIGTGEFDLTIGKIEAAGSNCAPQPGCGSDIITQTNDDFQLGGTEPGVPVNFRAELHTRLLFYFYGWAEPYTESMLIRDAFGSEASVVRTEPAPPSTPSNFERDTTLAIVVTAIPGAPFRIHCEASANGHSPASGVAYALLSFADLPPGAFITSCQGYRQEIPVTTLPTTWGRMKASYR